MFIFNKYDFFVFQWIRRSKEGKEDEVEHRKAQESIIKASNEDLRTRLGGVVSIQAVHNRWRITAANPALLHHLA